MQPSIDSYEVSRRALDFEDYVDVIRRHKAWILGPTFAALVVSVVVAFLWPDTYVSTAIIKVVPPQVPETYVPTNVNLEMSTRINAMAQNIVSRANLTNIITTYGLYPRERNSTTIEDLLETMKSKKIHISNVANVATTGAHQAVPAFQISFEYENRLLAKKVVEELSTKFINENLKERQDQSSQTTKFLEDQLDNARRDLEVLDQKLTQFRIKNTGHLPEQVQVNMQQVTALENRLSNLNSSYSRSNQEKMVMESQKRIRESQLKSLAPPAQDQIQAVAKNERVGELERQVQQAEAQLAALREHYKESYPDVQRMISVVNGLKKTRDAAMKEEVAKKPETPAAQPTRAVSPTYLREQRDIEADVQRMNTAIQAKDYEMEEIKKDIATTNAAIKSYEARVDSAPISDQTYVELIRDRDLAKQRYDEMSRRRTQSGLATELERRSQGERLEILDPASLPMTATEPKRPIWIGIGTAAGFALGIFLAGAREMKDTSLKNLKDVRAYTQLNILGVAPLLENDLVVRRRRRMAWLAWSTAVLMGLFIMSGSVFYYFTFRV